MSTKSNKTVETKEKPVLKEDKTKVETKSAKQKTPLLKGSIIVTKATVLRDGGKRTSNAMRKLEKGTKLKLIEDGEEFIKVELTNGYTGFVFKKDLKG